MQTPQQRIAELTEQLNHHNHLYYDLSNPVINDYDFDMLLEELTALEKQHPQLAQPDSPTQRVGGSITKEFEQVVHKYPMMSLGNTYSFDELQDFDNRIRKQIGDNFEYVAELKIDGCAIGITYENGHIKRAVTRGDGTQGDDVTTNIKTIRSVPLKLKGEGWPAEFEVRGEVYFPLDVFEKINKEREADGEPTLANPRNAASGTLKMQDSAVVAKRKLNAFLYFLYGENLPYETHWERLQAVKSWGFNTSEHTRLCKNINEVIAFINHWESERNNLNFETDGIVVKVNNVQQQQMLGFTAKSPRWAIAFKYKAEQVSTVLNEITYQVGRTGAITPVANLTPVPLGGTVVKRASLHNADQIALLDVREGDTVFVEKGGEIIPKVVGVDLTKRPAMAMPVVYITHCPEWGTQLVREEGEAKHFCPNEYGCPPQLKGKVEHYASRKALNIDNLGSETIDLLFERDLIKNIADIYTLNEEMLLPLKKKGNVWVNNLLKGIEDSKNKPFERVLFGLGIRYVGETVAKKLAYHFKHIDALMAATYDELRNVNEIGDVIAQSLAQWFADGHNQQLIADLKIAGVQFELTADKAQPKSTKLDGLIIVVSGTFKTFSRDGIKDTIEQNGGKVSGSISGKTNYVVAGEDMGPAKLEKANKLGVKIITEEEFIQLLE